MLSHSPGTAAHTHLTSASERGVRGSVNPSLSCPEGRQVRVGAFENNDYSIVISKEGRKRSLPSKITTLAKTKKPVAPIK